MGKLSQSPARLAAAPRRLGFGDADTVRAPAAPWKAWYKTTRWAALKREAHVRDAWVCRRSGVLCSGRYPAADSAVANHRRPHRGDPALF